MDDVYIYFNNFEYLFRIVDSIIYSFSDDITIKKSYTRQNNIYNNYPKNSKRKKNHTSHYY